MFPSALIRSIPTTSVCHIDRNIDLIYTLCNKKKRMISEKHAGNIRGHTKLTGHNPQKRNGIVHRHVHTGGHGDTSSSWNILRA